MSMQLLIIGGCAKGPLVYPSGHVMIYNALYSLTDDGADIFRAQCIFTVVYLAALSVVMACYRNAKVNICPKGML